MALGNADRAIAEYERIPETAEQYSLARAKLLEAQLAAFYFVGAEETIESLIMDNATAYFAAIGYHVAQSEGEEAASLLEEGLEQFPEDPSLLTVDSHNLWTIGRREEALARLKPALAAEPASPHAHLLAGQMMISSRDVIQAERHFSTVLSVNPNHQLAMLSMAAIARDRGDTQEAENWIGKAGSSGHMHPVGLLFAAQMAFDDGDTMRAFELIERTPAAVADQPNFLRLRGLIDAAREQHGMAVLSLGDYVEKTGGDVMTRQMLANSLAAQNRLDEAWDAIAPVVDHPQMEVPGLVLAMRLASATEQADTAKIEMLLERRLAAPAITEELREAAVAIRSSDWAKADRIYAPLLDGAGKSNPALLNNAAAVKTKLGEHSEAVTLARRALSEAPKSPEVQDTLGWALWQSGSNKAEARELLQKAREGAPGNREIAEHWAIVNAE